MTFNLKNKTMKKDELRKVKYQRNPEVGIFDCENDEEYNDLTIERKGWFHQWIEGESIALIENEEGEIEKIDSTFLKFIDE
jgi:hypothetical protein